MKKFKMWLTVLALMPTAALADTESVWLTDAAGSVTELQLADRPDVRFNGNEIVVTAGDTVISFEGEGISFSFTDPNQDGVETTSIASSDVAIRVSGDTVALTGLTPGTDVAAFNVSGVKTGESIVAPDGCATLHLTKGINIIATEAKTFKIIIK